MGLATVRYEMGMGKTAVCAALILGRLSTAKLDEKAFVELKNRTERQTKFFEHEFLRRVLNMPELRSRALAWMTKIDGQQYAGSGRATDFVRPDEWMTPQTWVPLDVPNCSGVWKPNGELPNLRNPEFDQW